VHFPFSPKLRLAILWPALVALLVVTALLFRSLPRVLETAAAEELVDTGAILAASQADRIAALADDPVAAQAWATRLTDGGNLRLTLIRADGRVIADSSRTPDQVPAMENHAGRPEVLAAMARGSGTSVRKSDTTGASYVYAARTVPLPKGGLMVLRLARPIGTLAAVESNVGRVLLLAVAAALLAIMAVSWWITRSLFVPLSRVIHGAERLAGGDLGHRLEVPEEDELSTLAGAVNRLAAQVETQIAAVGEERDHLRRILSSMTDGVLVTDGEGRALLTNAAFRALFDAPREVTGMRPLEITRQRTLDRLVHETLAAGQSQNAELEQDTPVRRTLALTSAVLTNLPAAGVPHANGNGGAAVGCVIVARDITAFTRLSEMRRDFVANVSHELKTPLAAIRGYAETLRDGALEDHEAAPRFLGRVLEQCKRLQALLDDLLTLSRLERPGSAPERQPVDLASVARRSAETLAAAAAERRVRVEVRTIGDGAPMLQADADGMERMVTNLLDNAVKYNRPGGNVVVQVGRSGDQALFEVRDSGIGIPAEALPRIFERFYRVDKGRSREEGGTGLGLAIVKHVAQLHGGRVEVDSTLGEGSRFRVYLPLAAAGEDAVASARR
jgi:two-component system phosphate regulon sensor histidine kinase PhoR